MIHYFVLFFNKKKLYQLLKLRNNLNLEELPFKSIFLFYKTNHIVSIHQLVS